MSKQPKDRQNEPRRRRDGQYAGEQRPAETDETAGFEGRRDRMMRTGREDRTKKRK